MRTFLSIIILALLVSVSHLVYAQDCDLVQEQACCYAEIKNGGDTSYCCNGSIVGNPSSSGASALDDLTCCQDDGRTGISVGFDITTCRAGSATPLTAKGTAASTVADVIKSLSASRSMSRESLYSSASVSRASAADSHGHMLPVCRDRQVEGLTTITCSRLRSQDIDGRDIQHPAALAANTPGMAC